MGYYTSYSLTVQDANPDETSGLVGALKDRCEEAKYSLEADGSSTHEGCKWYEHENDLREFSKSAPTKIFILRGEGEESGDIWKKYFRDGKCQVAKAQIVIEPFDASKLE